MHNNAWELSLVWESGNATVEVESILKRVNR
jgi:hypothetical protein